MRRMVLVILAMAIFLPLPVQAYDVLILQSRQNPAYEEVLQGFRFAQKTSLRLLVLSDYAEVDVVGIVREDQPKVVLAIGDAALAATRKIRHIPVVAVMALGIQNQRTTQQNLTGINMFAPPERYLSMFREMKIRRVGVVYNRAKSGWYMRLAQQAAENAGIELITREVAAPRETIEKMASLAGKIDVLWMLPDSTAVTRETTEAYFHFGQQYAIPVVSFAASYLKLGAAAALEIDRLALGRQADALISTLLQGGRVENLPPGLSKNTHFLTNPGILRRLGFSFTEDDFRLQ